MPSQALAVTKKSKAPEVPASRGRLRSGAGQVGQRLRATTQEITQPLLRDSVGLEARSGCLLFARFTKSVCTSLSDPLLLCMSSGFSVISCVGMAGQTTGLTLSRCPARRRLLRPSSMNPPFA
ncbi:unnamed protein product [Effrenium voratum]|uniref:Uncharacterized protein n=1 Tax=Effrenium voratum TaxID=2562239 RepID=A0AA36N1G0_9DINO|nr:unnamed protein product [Effrenium voratum]CAJ1445796.1 unnamed protein product [Effrenium voratum]